MLRLGVYFNHVSFYAGNDSPHLSTIEFSAMDWGAVEITRDEGEYIYIYSVLHSIHCGISHYKWEPAQIPQQLNAS